MRPLVEDRGVALDRHLAVAGLLAAANLDVLQRCGKDGAVSLLHLVVS